MFAYQALYLGGLQDLFSENWDSYILCILTEMWPYSSAQSIDACSSSVNFEASGILPHRKCEGSYTFLTRDAYTSVRRSSEASMNTHQDCRYVPMGDGADMFTIVAHPLHPPCSACSLPRSSITSVFCSTCPPPVRMLAHRKCRQFRTLKMWHTNGFKWFILALKRSSQGQPIQVIRTNARNIRGLCSCCSFVVFPSHCLQRTQPEQAIWITKTMICHIHKDLKTLLTVMRSERGVINSQAVHLFQQLKTIPAPIIKPWTQLVVLQ